MNSPSTIQAVILGLCLGAIYGLFFYQRYRSQYFWLLSVTTGVLSAILMNVLIRQLNVWEDQFLFAALLQLALPSLAVIGINRGLLKQNRKRRRNSNSDDFLATHQMTSFL